MIGMGDIKNKRLTKPLNSHPGLHIGDCVPFYFCPRSVMLYVIARRNSNLEYRGGEGPIVHLEADLYDTITWASKGGRRWAFTTVNAAANYAEDFADMRRLNRIDWDAVQAWDWSIPSVKASKQAEFLVEDFFPWSLVTRIGCRGEEAWRQAVNAVMESPHRPPVRIMLEWYYNFDDKASR